MKRTLYIIVALSLLLIFNHLFSSAFAQGTAFTYQGQLQNTNGLVHGTYNFSFSLFNTNINGTPIAGPVTVNGVVITNGLFTVAMDFGASVWNGQTNWLQIAVETNGASSFTNLFPRQQLTPVPYAIYAESSSNLSGTVSASQLTSIGNSAPNADNFFVGPSGNAATSGIYNTANGYSALLGSSGSYNTANGAFALNNSIGELNTAIGAEALGLNTSGSYNTAVGAYALIYNKSGSNNVAEGYGALEFNTNDNDLVAIGYEALQNDNAYGNGFTSDDNGHNTAVGYQALQLNTIGYINTAIGYQALSQNVNGGYNTANGDKALYSNLNGSYNTADGGDALYANTSGSFNTANGVDALFSNLNGSGNTANGFDALLSNTSGQNNVANGINALFFNTSGSNNVADGAGALYNSTNDSDLVAIGYEALQNDNAYGNGFTLDGNGHNIAVGFQSLHLTTIGAGNTAIGDSTLYSNTNGSFNTANGYLALYSNLNGSFNTANGGYALANSASGYNNIGLGYGAGENLQSGTNNIYIGNNGVTSETGIIRIGQPGTQTATYLAGNVSIGGVTPGQELSINGGMDVDAAASDNGTVNNNWTLLFGGASAGEGMGSVRVADLGDSFGLNFYTDYHKRMTILQNGNVGIGTTNADALLSVNGTADKPGGGSWSTFSDGRLKDVGADFTHGLEALDAIQPVHYHYKAGNPLNLPSQPDYVGVVAQQVQGAIPEAVHRDQDGYLVVNNDPIIWTMFNAIKELDQKRESEDKANDLEIQNLKQQNQTLQQQNDLLAERLNDLTAIVKTLEQKNGGMALNNER